jgi:hypothetical protein
MWFKRLCIVISATTICAGSSLSMGPGTAAAITPGEIVRAAEEIVPTLARRFGLAEERFQTVFVSQASKLTPVADEGELRTVQNEWTAFVPRKPAPQEVVLRPREVPSFYEEAAGMLCETAGDLLVTDDKSMWEFTINQVDGQIAQLSPAGRNLALYNELNDIADKFQSGCYCAATAKLAVLVAKETYC